MEKLRESTLPNGRSLKVYQGEKNSNAIEMIDLLKESINISSITVKENVELDMQTFGSETYQLNYFLSNYDIIRETGRDLSYSINGSKGEVVVSIGFAEDTNFITLNSFDSSIELSDLIQEKKTDYYQK